MEQLIIIVPATDKRCDYKKVKQQIVAYVGSRLVEDKVDEAVPAVMLKEILPFEERKTLTESIFKGDGTLIFIEMTEDDLDDDAVCLSCRLT